MSKMHKGPLRTCTRSWKYGALLGCTMQIPLIGQCDLGEFTTSSTVTLDGREVLSFIIRGALLTPLEAWIDQGIDQLFDTFEGDEQG